MSPGSSSSFPNICSVCAEGSRLLLAALAAPSCPSPMPGTLQVQLQAALCCRHLKLPMSSAAGHVAAARSCCMPVASLFPRLSQLAPTTSSAAGAEACAGCCPGITFPAILPPQISGKAFLLLSCELNVEDADFVAMCHSWHGAMGTN